MQSATRNNFQGTAVFIPGDVHNLSFWAKHLGGSDFEEVRRWRWRLGQAVRERKLKAMPRKGDKDPIQVAAVDLELWLGEGQQVALSPQELREIRTSTV